MLYRFRTVDRIEEPPSLAAAQGTVLHRVLEMLYDLPAPGRTRDAAEAFVSPAWQETLQADPRLSQIMTADDQGTLSDWEGRAAALLDTYFALEDPSALEPASREQYVAARVVEDLWLHGFVDRIDVSARGDVRIVDYKTGRAPGPGFEAGPMFQLRCYALVLQEMTGRLPRVLQLLYLGDGHVLRYEPDQRDLDATRRKVGALWQAIVRAHSSGDFRPRTSALCGWCAHRDICPAWGGTPPPLPDDRPPGRSTRSSKPDAAAAPRDTVAS
jgi:putative RecB family exonuclease